MCHLQDILGLTQVATSKHLAYLRERGLVESRRHEQWTKRPHNLPPPDFNQSLLHSGSCDPLLQRREESEHRYLREVVAKQSTRTAWLPWQSHEPIGVEALARLAASKLSTTSSP